MSIFGVGPVFVALSALYTAVALTLRALYPQVFTITCVPRWVLVTAGAVLLGIGVPFFFAALATLVRGFPQGKLFTSGVYATCRHPVYGAWVVFNVPGMVLLVGNSIGLLVPVAMYATLRVLVRKEERFLEDAFGDEYRAYRKRTPSVFPLLWRWRASTSKLRTGS